MELNSGIDPENQGTQDAANGTPEPSTAQQDDPIVKLESRLRQKESMIGKQGNEIGALRKELEGLRAQITPKGPSEQDMLADLYRKMDSGEIDIANGMQQALQLNSNLTAKQVMSQFQEQQRQQKIMDVQQKFIEKNPDYQEVLESGALDKYLSEDPLADEYTAFKMYKADQRLAESEKAAQAKIAAAKEEGAKLAKGAEAAGKVLGKQGASAAVPAKPQGPWKSTQEAQDAMLQRLKELRGASAQ